VAGPQTIQFDANVGRNSGAPEEVLPLAGASLLELSKRTIPADKTLLGNRWLCSGGGAMIVGPSGIGKSTLAVQAAALWSCGRSAFGIRPSRPLRVLIIQSEDDEGDTIEMAKVVNHLELRDEELELVGQNTHLEFLNDLTGFAFTKRLNEMLGLLPCDLGIINPLSAYLGCDTKDEENVNQFLRTWISPILTTNGVAVIFIHHTPKTTNRDTSEWGETEWMYSGSGVAGITNWARAYIAIDPRKGAPGVYKFIAAKRGQRIGWDGLETYWAHCREKDKLLWVPVDRDQIALAKRAKVEPDDLLPLIPVIDPILQEELFLKAGQRKIGEKKVRNFVKVLLHRGTIHEHKIDRNGVKSGKGYAKTPQRG
jgi:AAA domain